jgi:uncharacterized membrane protein
MTVRHELAARDSPQLPWTVRLSAPKRLAIVLAICIALFVMLPRSQGVSGRLLVCWDVGGATYLLLAWITIVRADAHMTKLRARLYDQSGYVIFLLILAAACASVVAIGAVVGGIKDLPAPHRAPKLVLSIAALVLSWLLIQTLFAFHYAREYYAVHATTGEPRSGLIFPGGEDPDYVDFAYYSFVVGMTSQVSDVAVASREMRHVTLVHGALAFFFNLAILALSVNIISGTLY